MWAGEGRDRGNKAAGGLVWVAGGLFVESLVLVHLGRSSRVQRETNRLGKLNVLICMCACVCVCAGSGGPDS